MAKTDPIIADIKLAAQQAAARAASPDEYWEDIEYDTDGMVAVAVAAILAACCITGLVGGFVAAALIHVFG